MYQRKVDVDMLNALKSVLADVSSVSPSSEQRAFEQKLHKIEEPPDLFLAIQLPIYLEKITYFFSQTLGLHI